MTETLTISPDNVVGYLKHRPMLKAREDMLSPQAPPRYQPLQRYSQYETGRQEQFARRRPRTETP